MGSAAAKCSFGRVIPGTDHVRGGRDGFIRSLIDNVAGPHTDKYPHPDRGDPGHTALAGAQNTPYRGGQRPDRTPADIRPERRFVRFMLLTLGYFTRASSAP